MRDTNQKCPKLQGILTRFVMVFLIYLYNSDYSLQKLQHWVLVASPFVLFFILGTLFQSSLNYYLKAAMLLLTIVCINLFGRLCSITSDTTMESLPVSIYLATKVFS